MEVLRLKGQEARAYAKDLAELRLRVFYDYPYLYEGDAAYEEQYLETYFKAENAFVLFLRDGERMVGATTGIHAAEEEESLRKPFVDGGFPPEKVFYFGESVILDEYRGRGFGKLFFQEREIFARDLGFIDYLSFCSVQRAANHPLKPADYQPLDNFWKAQGFLPVPGMISSYDWKDRGDEQSTAKPMQFWMKKLNKGV